MGGSLCRKRDLGKLFQAEDSMAEGKGVWKIMECGGNCKPFGIAKKGKCGTVCGWQSDWGACRGLWRYSKVLGLCPEVTESQRRLSDMGWIFLGAKALWWVMLGSARACVRKKTPFLLHAERRGRTGKVKEGAPRALISNSTGCQKLGDRMEA